MKKPKKKKKEGQRENKERGGASRWAIFCPNSQLYSTRRFIQLSKTSKSDELRIPYLKLDTKLSLILVFSLPTLLLSSENT